MAFTALTHTRASCMGNSSIALAACSTISRIASSSIRTFAMFSVFPPSLANGLPKASRDMPRDTINDSARSPRADCPHAVMDSPRPEAELERSRNLDPRRAACCLPVLEHCRSRICMWPWGCIVRTEHMHRTDDSRHQVCPSEPGFVIAALVLVLQDFVCTHGDHHFAPGTACSRDPVFLAVDDPFIAVAHRLGRNVLCVRRSNRGFGHTKA